MKLAAGGSYLNALFSRQRCMADISADMGKRRSNRKYRSKE
jgi:hypothetical protein